MLYRKRSSLRASLFCFLCRVRILQQAVYCVVFLLCTVIGQAQKDFHFNDRCAQAYHHIMALRLAPASKLLAAEKAADPNNLATVLLDNYIDFFTLFFNEEKTAYDKAKVFRSQRLAQLDAAPKESPLRLFAKAIVHLQWAAIHIKFNEKWAAGWDFRDAFKLAKQNQQQFPQFSPNGMITGPMEMVAATIPKSMRWLSSIMGISGTMQHGSQQLEAFLHASDNWAKLFREEGIFYHCYLQNYLLNQPEKAFAFIEKQDLDLVNNHLFAYMAANLHLTNKQSWQTQRIIQQRKVSADYLTTAVWDFEMAYARLFHLEADAPVYFNRFLQQFKGNFYVKDAWLKLGYHYYLQGNNQQYQYCMQQVKQRGNTLADADKRALKEAQSGWLPNKLLLKARLLSDGGYSKEALALLEGKSANDFADMAERLEFAYRLGRIYDDLALDDRALKAYDYTIAQGSQRTEYYAARSALQAGMICEKLLQFAKARAYFQKAMDMQNHDYEESIEQKAKAGLERCKGK